MEYAVPLFILADEVRCDEAINNCIRVISENLEIHQRWCGSRFDIWSEISSTWTLLVKNKSLGNNSKARLMGLMMKKNISILKNNQDDKTEKELNIITEELVNLNKRSDGYKE